MISAVLIIPSRHHNLGESFAAYYGWSKTPGRYLVALREKEKSVVITHYGCAPYVSQEFLSLISDPPMAAVTLLSELISSFSTKEDHTIHFARVLTEQGLELVPEEETQ